MDWALQNSDCGPVDLTRNLCTAPALAMLLDAYQRSDQTGREVRELAVGAQVLKANGLSLTTIDLLVRYGYLLPVYPAPAPTGTWPDRGEGREAASRPPLSYALSREGAVAVGQFLLLCLNRLAPQEAQSDSPPASPPVPRWSAERRELRWGGQVVKRYHEPAPNQEAILATFEEEGWPHRIDDPLTQSPHMCAKHRLHDTIKNLNRYQSRRLIRFRGDGTGQGVRWEPVLWLVGGATPKLP